MKWPILSFTEAITDVTGGNIKIQKKAYLQEGKIPIIDQGQELISGYTNDHAIFRGEIPIVIFGDHTRIFKYIDFPFALGADGVKALQANDLLVPKFLFYFCKNLNIPSKGYSRHFKFLKQTNIPLPSRYEQHKIVEILDQANHLQNLCVDAEKNAERILTALFIKMFGNPATNPRGWDVIKLSKAIKDVKNGISRRRKTERNEGDAVLRLKDIKKNVIFFDELNRITLDAKEREKYNVDQGDLLFIRVNGNKEYVGRCAVFKGYKEPVYFNDHIMRVKVDFNIINPNFLSFFLNLPAGKQEIFKGCKTSAGQYTISQLGLGMIELPLPPVIKQNDFYEISKKYKKIDCQIKKRNCQITKTFNNLLYRAFTGDLTASWRQAHMEELLQEMEIQARVLAK
jgi:type I restriction enzyme S subunit